MKYWGVEVGRGSSLKVTIPVGKALHLSTATLSHYDSGRKNVHLFHHCGGRKNILGTLNPRYLRSWTWDLVLEQEFELSHTSKEGPVSFHGYLADNPDEGGLMKGGSKDGSKPRIRWAEADGVYFCFWCLKRTFSSEEAVKIHCATAH